MIRMSKIFLIALALLILMAATVTAHPGVMADQEYMNSPQAKLTGTTGNGFPSGKFYELNIIGKEGDFTCPHKKEGASHRSVLFIPIKGENIKIIVQSAPAGTKKLLVTEPCADATGDKPAVVQLPPNEQGYLVFARPAGRPGGTMQITPSLSGVENSSGIDLASLGLVTDNGFLGSVVTLSRTRDSMPSGVTDLSGLFVWSGIICDITPESCNPPDSCTSESFCCTDANGDGVYESCSPKGDACATGTAEITAYCKTFENESVSGAGVGGSIDYLWEINNDHLQFLQVRFYPISH